MQHNSFNTKLSFFQKIKNFDYILLICILLLGLISSISQCIQQMEEKFYFIAKVIYQNF